MTDGLEAELERLDPVHPGEVLLRDFLEPMGLSQLRLATETGLPVSRINAIVRHERAITADTALRLGRFFGVDPRVWLGLQMQYDLEVAARHMGDRLEREVRPRVSSPGHA
ncbi:MAG: HigA family addiction module antitoxin [bacterium]|nr:HigA family addiction module antitoxin [bacterium]